MARSQVTNLVLEGGGVKGLGLVGAISALDEAGFRYQRVAGTSAGAVVGSLVAAGMNAQDMQTIMGELDYLKFQDKNALDEFGPPGEVTSLLIKQGIFKGAYLHRWLREQLAALGVRTFRDLAIREARGQELPPSERYKLVVVASDVSRGELVRLPWDYHRYGLDPDKQLVADAVRASMSIPFFFEPWKIGRSTIVDGGMLSDFPVGIFDGATGQSGTPTVGVKLSAKPQLNKTIHPVHSTLELATALFSTMQQAHDMMHLEDPAVVRRTIFVDTGSIKPTDFAITRQQQQQLFSSGLAAGQKFLKTWDPAAGGGKSSQSAGAI